MGRLARILGLSVVLLSSWGCQDDPPPAPAVPAPPAAPAEPVAEPPAQPPERTPAQATMRGHFEQARVARQALIRADIEKAREAMQWLGTHPLGDTLPADKGPLMAAMQTAARMFADAQTLRDAGKALATTLTKCGDCHQAGGEGPTFATPGIPEGDDAISHMRRHHWAIDRMWEGLVAGDTSLFEASFQGLLEAQLSPADLKAPAELADKVAALTKHVHELGTRAQEAKDTAARAEAFGELLATCATCHRMLERGPKPLPEEDAPSAPSQ